MNEIRVLHIDTAKTWRGGQQQAAYLHTFLNDHAFFSLMICQPHSAMEEYCKQHELLFVSINMYGELDVKAVYQIVRIIKKNHCTILHAHTAHALSIGILCKIFHKNIHLVGVRRVAFSIRKNALSAWKYKTSLINKLVCISKSIKQILIAEGIPKTKISTIYSGIDIHKFDACLPADFIKEKYNILENDKIVTTIAALERNKDYITLLHAAQRVLEIDKNVTFLSIGAGSREKELKDTAQKLQIDDKFQFLEFHKDVGPYLKITDIFLLVSKKEGLGSSILDALSVGLPVIATNTGGIPEVVTNNVNGLLVPTENPEKLSHAIIHLLKNDKLRLTLSQSAKESVRKFSVDAMYRKYLKLYEKLTK